MANETLGHRVFVRRYWNDDWTLTENLFADQVAFCCAPEMPEALLYWNYGDILPYGGTGFSVRAPLDYTDYFVLIEILQDGDSVEWYGVIKGEVSAPRGAGNDNLISGQQYLKAYGMEWFLDRKQLTTSWVQDIDGSDKEINRCIGFNMGAGDENNGQLIANMSTVAGTENAFIFCPSMDDAQPWTAYSIVDYLLTYHSPRDANGEKRIPFILDPEYSEALLSLDWWKASLSYEGRTVKEALDSIMHRNRMMSYRVTVSGSDVLIQPFTFSESDIELPSGDGKRIRQNALQTVIEFENEARVKQLVLNRDVQTTYDRVRVRGERVGVVFTMKNPTTLEADWDSSLQTEYNDGSAAAASATNNYAKALYHRNFRNTDKFSRVYRHFRIPSDWDGKNQDTQPVIIDPATVSLTETTDPAEFWLPGLRIEPYLPLRMDTDYETVTTVENIDALTGDDRPPEFRRPFAVYQKTEATRAFFLHKPEGAQSYGAVPETGERTWACYVSPQTQSPGIILDVSGAPQHVIAEDEFTPVADGADDNDWQSELDWKEVQVTVFLLLDQYATEEWPDTPASEDLDIIRELTIDVPGKRQIWLVPETVIDINQDGTLKRSDGGWIENDSEELKDMARLIFEWYRRERRAIDLQVKTTEVDGLTVGTLITTIGSGANLTTTNSVITRLMFDLRENSHSVYTQYAELDLRGL